MKYEISHLGQPQLSLNSPIGGERKKKLPEGAEGAAGGLCRVGRGFVCPSLGEEEQPDPAPVPGLSPAHVDQTLPQALCCEHGISWAFVHLLAEPL